MADQDGISVNQTVDSDIDTRLMTKTIMETLASDPALKQAADAYRRAGLEAKLSALEALTVFAPADGRGDEDALRRAMLALPVTEAELRRSGKFKLHDGTMVLVTVAGEVTQVGKARMVRSDIQCTNGVLHVLDTSI